MGTRLHIDDDHATLSLSGRLGVSSAPEVHERLTEALASGRKVDIDLAELGEMDAALVQLLVSAHASAEARGLELGLSRRGYAFEQGLRRAGLEHLLDEAWVSGADAVQFFFFDDEEAA